MAESATHNSQQEPRIDHTHLPTAPTLAACGCGPSCGCGCQSGGPCQCGGCG